MLRKMLLYPVLIPNRTTPHATLYVRTPYPSIPKIISRIFPDHVPILNVSLQSSTKCQCHDAGTQQVCPARSSDRSCSTLGRGTGRASLLAGKVVQTERKVSTADFSVIAHTRKRAVRRRQLCRQSREVVAAPAPVHPISIIPGILFTSIIRTPWNIPDQRIGNLSRRSTASMRRQWCHCLFPSCRQ
jgi:hypothetical protein